MHVRSEAFVVERRALEPRGQVEIHVCIGKEPNLPLGVGKSRRFRIITTDHKARNAALNVRPCKDLRKIRDIRNSLSRRLRLQEYAFVAGRLRDLLVKG